MPVDATTLTAPRGIAVRRPWQRPPLHYLLLMTVLLLYCVLDHVLDRARVLPRLHG